MHGTQQHKHKLTNAMPSKRRLNIPMVPTHSNPRYQGRNGFTQLPQTQEQQQEAFDHAMNTIRFQSVAPPRCVGVFRSFIWHLGVLTV
jgi:hypothetical protein